MRKIALLLFLMCSTPQSVFAQSRGYPTYTSITDLFIQSAAGLGTSDVDNFLDLIVSGFELLDKTKDAFEPLSEDDKGFVPNFDPAGMPQIPSKCASDSSEICTRCYATTTNDLMKIRMNLEKLRRIYQSFMKYTAGMLDIGNAASGLHGMTALAGVTKKHEIQKTVNELSKTYDEKLSQFLTSLEKSLQAMGECEREVFGIEDWYVRFGYIYYSFVSDRYKR